jgi:phospholipid-binding lipoprotein MlaA
MTPQIPQIAIRLTILTLSAIFLLEIGIATATAVRASVPENIKHRLIQTAATWRDSVELQKLISRDPNIAALTGSMNRRVYSSMMAQTVIEAISLNPSSAAEVSQAAFQAAPELKSDIIQKLTMAFPANAGTFTASFPPIRVPLERSQPRPVGSKLAVAPNDDPIEGFNRFIFGINDVLDSWLLVPVAKAYRFIMPNKLREMGRNFFENLSEPVVAINDLLQGDLENTGVSVGRFLINSTAGLFGVFEVADELDLKAHPADFGQTLHSYGVASGPYIVLPFFGPSTVRDAVGSGVDSFLNPLSYLLDFEARIYLKGSELVVKREEYLDQVEELKKGSIDYYAAFRAAWAQRRMRELQKGKPRVIDNLDALFKDVK